ncbi:protein kinase C [Sarcoptes scabiei]|nr:protein kinase C [Sarcoptes scabiei]
MYCIQQREAYHKLILSSSPLRLSLQPQRDTLPQQIENSFRKIYHPLFCARDRLQYLSLQNLHSVSSIIFIDEFYQYKPFKLFSKFILPSQLLLLYVSLTID